MSAAFKGRHFAPDVILLCMRWYCRYALSYRDLEEMMAERGLSVDHTTIYRWVQHYAPELDRRVQWCSDRDSGSWYVDETYVKVGGEWMYLYRAVGDGGETLDFYLSQTRMTKAAKHFLSRALNRARHHQPLVISRGKNLAYNEAITSLRRDLREQKGLEGGQLSASPPPALGSWMQRADPPPLNVSILTYGFDHDGGLRNGPEETQAR